MLQSRAFGINLTNLLIILIDFTHSLPLKQNNDQYILSSLLSSPISISFSVSFGYLYIK